MVMLVLMIGSLPLSNGAMRIRYNSSITLPLFNQKPGFHFARVRQNCKACTFRSDYFQHPLSLPKYKDGTSTLPILNGESKTGVTFMKLMLGLILDQSLLKKKYP